MNEETRSRNLENNSFAYYFELRNVTFRLSLRGGAKRRRGNLHEDGIASLHFVPIAMTERVSFVIQGY